MPARMSGQALSRARAVLRGAPARGPVLPWHAEFDHSARPCPPGLVLGPPDFVGIGAQKAGTSWWYDLIAQHPDAYHHPAYDKERHFLVKRGMAGAIDDPALAADYASWFPRPAGARTGEWTPGYLFYFWVADLLAEVAPETKVLVLLRDPVERYLSGLAHARGEAARSASGTQLAYERGFYARQLAAWETRFPAPRLLVLQYEACCRAPAAELARTYRFLGLDDTFVPPGLGAGHTPNPKPALGSRRTGLLRSAYEPDVRALAERHPGLDLGLWPHFAHLREGRAGARA